MQRQLIEGTALFWMRQFYSDEFLMEVSRDMDPEQRLELLKRHPNQCRSMMLSNIDDD